MGCGILSHLEDRASVLSEFGLTHYESKVYLSVLQLGPCTAANITKVTGIRREEVYRTLPKLERTGLIERLLGRPSKVRALPIEDALSILIHRKEEEADLEIRNLIAKKVQLLEMFLQVTQETMEDNGKSSFTLISEKDALEKRISSLIKKATQSIKFVDNYENTFRFFITFSEELINARKRGVTVTIITEIPHYSQLIPETLNKYIPINSFIIRYCETLPGNYIIFDEHDALITTEIGSGMPTGRSLWTDDPSLIRIIQSDFNNILEISIDWKDHKETSDEKLKQILRDLKPRDHVILIYESIEAKRNTLFSYIDVGLRNREAVMYICSEESPEEIRTAMKKFGLDVEKYEEQGALKIIPYTDMYIREGVFNLDYVMDTWNKSYNDAITKGFKGMRATGEMNCFIEHDLVEELIDYEHALHAVLDIPMTAICAYNADILTNVDNPVDIYSELVKANGKVLFVGAENSVGRRKVGIS
ncbi:MAG: hypothetical protein E4H14_08305 [Candidatus Thorarchaeota archaeon]|nr:MAG: hypothetical protein E4H14_08305 [Candidatus Thorarchaeota archaeon]